MLIFFCERPRNLKFKTPTTWGWRKMIFPNFNWKNLNKHLLWVNRFHLIKFLIGPVAPISAFCAGPVTSQKSSRPGRPNLFWSAQRFSHFSILKNYNLETNESTLSYQNRSDKIVKGMVIMILVIQKLAKLFLSKNDQFLKKPSEKQNFWLVRSNCQIHQLIEEAVIFQMVIFCIRLSVVSFDEFFFEWYWTSEAPTLPN